MSDERIVEVLCGVLTKVRARQAISVLREAGYVVVPASSLGCDPGLNGPVSATGTSVGTVERSLPHNSQEDV